MATEVATIAQFGALTAQRFLAPAVRQQKAAAFALVALAGAQVAHRAALGYVPKYQALVDGRRNAPLTSVKVDGGKIEFEFEVIDDILRWIAKSLREHSPWRSGEYMRGHLFYADGVECDVFGPIPQAREYIFINTVEYSTILELGTRAGKPFRFRMVPHIYENVAMVAPHVFPNRQVTIEFSFRGVIDGKVYAKSGPRRRMSAKYGRESRAPGAPQNKAQIRFPAIIVKV